MGLGGITRDSIADLASLVHDDDDTTVTNTNDAHLRRTASLVRSGRPSSFTSENKVASAEGDFFTEEEGEERRCVLNDDGEQVGPNDVSITNTAATVAAAPSVAVSPELHYGFQYEGYQDWYAEDFSPYYNQDGRTTSEKKNVFCCLFPWIGGDKDQMQQVNVHQDLSNSHEQTNYKVQTQVVSLPDSKSSSESLEGSNSNSLSKDQLGQELRSLTASPSHAAGVAVQDAEARKATALASPANATNGTTLHTAVTSPEKSLKNESPTKLPQDSPKPKDDSSSSGLKSILKVKRCINRFNSTTPIPSKKVQSASADGKRHLFPSYETKSKGTKKNNEREDRKIAFIPMARVLTIPSRKDIPLSQKAQVWWQRSDYDDFKKTGRIISKAMECGGSEIWLTSTNAWGKGQQSRAAAQEEKKKVDENEQLVGKETDTDSEYVKALEKYTNRSTKTTSASDNSNNSDFGNKWWCKFGHSRRGLEHIVSSSEGKARQQSVLLAIEMILEEQKRQRVTRTKDANKLRNVALQYTSWARDLALAAGAADHEAVETNFDLAAKSRSHHFAEKSKHLLLTDKIAGGGVAMAINSQILDENTHGRRNSVMGPSSTLKDMHLDHEASDTSLSKRAKGFIPGESSEVPASQIMSGMGNMTPRAALKA